jgi:hypothetical protein
LGEGLILLQGSLHQSKAGGKGIHIVHSRMSSLDYLTEPVRNCPKGDINDKAFVRVTMTIGGHMLLRNFCPTVLSAAWDLGEIEEAGAPLSKVVVPLPKFSAAKATKEKACSFIMRISIGADKLVGCYSWAKHQVCLSQIQNGRLNCVFEVADSKYLNRPVPEAPATDGSKKRKSAAASEMEGAP